MQIKIEVIKVRRGCKVYTEGDILFLENQKIISKNDQKSSCFSADCSIYTNLGRLIQTNQLFISCLDAGITSEGTGNVIFKITKEN